MTLVVIVLWIVAVPLTLIALFGARRWHRTFRLQVRPGAAEPTRAGYGWLNARNVLAATTALVVAILTTIDHVEVTEDELLTEVERATGLMDDEPFSWRRLEAQVGVLLDRDVRVKEVFDDVVTVPDVREDVDTTYYEVRATGVLDAEEDEPADTPVVCVEVETLVGAGGERLSSWTNVRPISCFE